MNNTRGIEMELPLFLITGFHPAGFFLGFILGMEDEVQPVFCMKANDLEGLQNITSDRLHVVGSPFEIPTNGIGIGRFMDAQCQLRDGYETYNKLQSYLASGNPIGVELHPIVRALVDHLEPKEESVNDSLIAPSNGSNIPQEPEQVIEEIVNDDSGHVGDDIVPSGEPEGNGEPDPAGSAARTIKVGKGSKG